jgi:hypothetical protein
MSDTHVRVVAELADAAREAGGFAPDAPLPQVVRWSMATAAGWPDAAARVAARAAREVTEEATDE